MTTDQDLDRLMVHLDSSVSPFHAVAHASTVLETAGFTRSDYTRLDGLPDKGYIADRGLLFAWQRGSESNCFRITGAHTDSPGLRVKPVSSGTNLGWKQIAVEVYGGILNNSWLDRDLGAAGVVVFADGTTTLVRSSRPVARVPQLAVHLDREVNDRGLILDRQQHLAPIWGLGEEGGSFVEWLAMDNGIDAREIRSWEICLFDDQKATLIGAESELLASGRIDNQVSCWAAVEALVGLSSPRNTAVVALFDHEEVGSESTTGAAGPRLEWLLESLHRGSRNDLHTAYSRSLCVSADCAHAIHPNYPDRHEAQHRPLPNRGPVIKINSNQRYATDSTTSGAFAGICDRAGVPHQLFVSKNNMPCGSTIGPITATRLGIPTVDVGASQLSMHSAREVCGSKDPALLKRALLEHFRT